MGGSQVFEMVIDGRRHRVETSVGDGWSNSATWWVDDEELARRRTEQDAKGWAPAAPRERHVSPALKIFAKFAQSADKGAARKVD